MPHHFRGLLPRSTESIAELYHHNTKLVMQARSVLPTFTGELHREQPRTRYARHNQMLLPGPDDLPLSGRSLEEVIATRRTEGALAPDPINFADLAALLHYGYGITGRVKSAGHQRALRAVPSAGAMHPAELYVAVRAVGGVVPGLYHHDGDFSRLSCLAAGDPTSALHEACAWQEPARTAAATIFIVGSLSRTSRKYGDRGYRYMLLEAGHIAQNLCLVATARDLAVVPIGGFLDDRANAMFRLDGIAQVALYAVCVGRPESSPP
jgi:SagB-type dehydrogenase family enzyme